MSNFDVGIIGAGVAGAFAAFKIAKEHKDLKTVVFDIGRPPMKRRRQLEGWLGCLPSSDGKLYINDVSKVSELIGAKKTKSALTYFNNVINNIDNFEITKDKGVQIPLEKRLKKAGYSVVLNDYMQMYPKDIHALSKHMAETIEQNSNITCSFDNEVTAIHKQKNMFVLSSERGEFKCKKLIIAVGRSGWRWARDIFNNFGIIESNDVARFGIRVETTSDIMREFNKSSCSLVKQDLEFGPFSWYGTIIPEDHVDMAISSFRSNENRWKTDKVSFSLIGHRPFPKNGFEQTDRLAKLTFVITNDRVIKERLSTILNKKSKISIMPEYDWLKPTLEEFATVCPELVAKGYFHVPTILPLAPKINIGNNLETEVENMFVVGESTGTTGLLSAALSGITVADMINN